MPTAWTRTSTSWGPGRGTGTVRRSKPGPAAGFRSACIVSRMPPPIGPASDRRLAAAPRAPSPLARLPSSSCPPDVNRIGGAGDPGGNVAAEVEHEHRHFVWLEQPLDGSGREHHFLHHLLLRDAVNPRLFGDLALDERRPHVGRADRVRCHTVVRDLQGYRPGESNDAVLGGDIGALERGSHQPVDRRYVEDSTPPAGDHVGQAVLGAEKRPGQHDADEQVPLLLGELVDRRDVLQPGVVDQDVETAERPHGSLDHLPDLIAVTHVGVGCDRVAAPVLDPFRCLARCAVVEIARAHRGARSRQCLGDRAADPAPGARHDRGPPSQVDRPATAHRAPPLVRIPGAAVPPAPRRSRRPGQGASRPPGVSHGTARAAYRSIVRKAATSRRTRSGSTGAVTIPSFLRPDPQIAPSACRSRSMVSSATPLPTTTGQPGTASFTTRISASRGGVPVSSPETITASAKPREAMSRATTARGRGASGAPCFAYRSAKIRTRSAPSARRYRTARWAAPARIPWSVTSGSVNTFILTNDAPTT